VATTLVLTASAARIALEDMQATVIVLGDLGRSPRMQYHTLALARQGIDVDLVGEHGTPCMGEVEEHARIRVHRLLAPRSARAASWPAPFALAYAALRVVLQTVQLFWILVVRSRTPDVVLVQNPPAIPALSLAALTARVRHARLIIDWHNFSHSMLSLRLSSAHPLVRLVRRHEHCMARRAHLHVCVSRAMRAELDSFWKVQAHVLYDRPAARFHPTPPAEGQALFRRLGEQLDLPAAWLSALIGDSSTHTQPGDRTKPPAPASLNAADVPQGTAAAGGSCVEQASRPTDRPFVVVSATSWTADEDFGLLLNSLVEVEARLASRRPPCAGLLVLITGDGPLRAGFEDSVRRRGFRRVCVRTVWLSADDYPLLLGAADLGVCVHRSASGLDLPMKILDMHGSGLPVCALDYGPVIRELVRPGQNGLLFREEQELAGQILQFVSSSQEGQPSLRELRRTLSSESRPSWEEEWRAVLLPLLGPATST
jgi:beta-1,4-mannosyltransferase